MRSWMILLPVLFPILAGALLPVFHFRKWTAREIYVSCVTLLNSAMIFAMIAIRWIGSSQGLQTAGGTQGLSMAVQTQSLQLATRFQVLQLTDKVSIAFRMDGLSMVFAGLLALLWPLASLYAFEYMREEGKENFFFAFYTMTYGVAAGVAFSANLITMYLCYELLTLITLPLIMHEMTVEAVSAGRKYLMYSIAGAACAFMGILILIGVSGSAEFTYGGVLGEAAAAGNVQLIRIAYLAAFLGFGVKAAIFPFGGWLPTAGAAPTPVTALLHAVAVVKAGAFAIMRITYYGFGTGVLRGSWVQYTVISMAAFTILYGSTSALKEQHIKRRLAFSTMSNLSYILLSVTMMSPEGLTGGLAHMLFHGTMKIVLFFGAGAVICHTHKHYIYQMRGLGKKMPVTFTCFIVGSLAIIGVPGLCGFISKWYIARAAIANGTVFGYIGVGVLIYSAVLTAIYLFTIIVPVFVPDETWDEKKLEDVHEAGWRMTLPMVFLCVMMLIFGLFPGVFVNFFASVGSGLI